VAEKKLVFVHPLAQLLNRQPDYKPLNLKEMTVSFALPSNEREVWYRVFETLERDDAGVDPIMEVLLDRGSRFDLSMANS
jgi:hypothetical protein